MTKFIPFSKSRGKLGAVWSDLYESTFICLQTFKRPRNCFDDFNIISIIHVGRGNYMYSNVHSLCMLLYLYWCKTSRLLILKFDLYVEVVIWWFCYMSWLAFLLSAIIGANYQLWIWLQYLMHSWFLFSFYYSYFQDIEYNISHWSILTSNCMCSCWNLVEFSPFSFVGFWCHTMRGIMWLTVQESQPGIYERIIWIVVS